MNHYLATIGIECHVQLKTKTKLFSAADNDARDKPANSVVNQIDFGLPGVLPLLNRAAVELAIKAGLALNAEVALVSSFDRKHYFYPDLPKGYQITQLARPIVGKGQIEVPQTDGSIKTVRITRAHLEEDAGKLTHPAAADFSLVDLNRAGTPLLEIVSEADMHSPAEAKAYAQELYLLMKYADVTNGDLYHGNMRFDVNVSVAAPDSTKLGIRTEIKNLNSFRSVEKSAEYEIKRQIVLLEKGEKVIQETRGWDEAKQKTTSQRGKEEAHDYRYFPDPDIPPVELSVKKIDEVRTKMPTMPAAYRHAWQDLKLDNSVTITLLLDPQIAAAVLEVQTKTGTLSAQKVAHWFASSMSLDETLEVKPELMIKTDGLIELAEMSLKDEVSSTAAKQIFKQMLSSGQQPRQIAETQNLLQQSNEAEIAKIVDQVLADPAAAKAIADIKAGNERAIGFLVGQVMQKSNGQANPGLATQLIKQKL